MMADAARTADDLAGRMRLLGTPERAASEKAYLKSSREHYGTSVPNMRIVAKEFLRAHPALVHDELLALCSALWSQPVHERRMLAVELLVARPKLLDGGDLPWIEQRLRESETWALVDSLAGQVVAAIVLTDRSQVATLDRWVSDNDFWIRRSAVLGLSKVLRNGDELERFFRYADTLLAEKEFFIRKVLGWVARETGRCHPDEVSAWLRRNLVRMNGVTIREAVKHLPDGPEILSAWKSR